MSTSHRDSVSSVVDSLTKSFERLPPATVPAVLDCILASTGISSSSLFDFLLDAFSDFAKEGDATLNCSSSSYTISFMSAMCYLVKKETKIDALQSFIWRGFLLILKRINPNDNELLNQIADLLCDIVIFTHSWQLMESTLVPFSLRTLGLSIGLLQNEEFAVYRWNRDRQIQVPSEMLNNSSLDLEAILLLPGSLPLSNTCHILTSLLIASLKSCQAVQNPLSIKAADGCGSPENFARNMLWDLSHLVLCMLSQCLEHRSCATHLLAVIFRALGAFPMYEVSVPGCTFVLSRGEFFNKIWKCCKTLFSHGPPERRDAYYVLSLCLSLFCTEGHDDLGHDVLGKNAVQDFDVREDEEFWKEIQRGLVDRDSLVRKQSLHVLKLSLGQRSKGQNQSVVSKTTADSKIIQTDHSITKRGKWAEKEAKSLGVGQICKSTNSGLNAHQRWEAFVLLYEMLDEFGTHLVEAAWTHQISLLLTLPDSFCINPIGGGGVFQIQMEALEGIFSWLVVLLERGFCHENPQVRCLIMQSFLGIDWEKCGNRARLVPEKFVLGPFLQGLNDVVHHKEFGLKGFYSSKIIEGASRFICQFSYDFPIRERISFLCRLASVAKHESFGRIGLMALAVCIASASGGTKTHCVVETQWEESTEVLLRSCSVNLLDALRIVIERSKNHFNPCYRLRVCEQVLVAATDLIFTSDVPLDVLLFFVSALPREFTDYGGPLRAKVQQWFSRSTTKNCCSNLVYAESQVLEDLLDFASSFVKNHQVAGAFLCFDDDDLDVWGIEAQRWARVLFLVITEEYHLKLIFKFIQNYGLNICTQKHSPDWVQLKFLILILSVVQELHIGKEKFTCYAADVGNNVKVATGAKLDQMCLSSPFDHFEKFTEPFFFILEELLSFAKLSSLAFWSLPVLDNGILPNSVRGKLGGPSQRRLASSTTSSLLQAIFAIKTVAYLSSWCAQIKGGACVESSLTFLWDFSWKVISTPECDSENGAEVYLAAYETLADVLKALATSFSPFIFYLMMDGNKSAPAVEENRAYLDPFILSFLENVNRLLTVGGLARSRRAILMNWKWLCLDSLLSIPCNAIAIGIQLENKFPFFADATLRSIFFDLVESLENAGESSVLPMLRSVRLVIRLLCWGKMSSTVSFHCNMDNEMMMQIVHSSWILHVSCNKRRVAPIAALLSAVLHSFVFNDLTMHETTDGQPGPLKWFVEKILDEGTKSPRTIRLAALHLTGLWLLYPRTIKYYMKELKLLSLYGSVAFDEDFEAELAENREAREEVSFLAQSPDSELTKAFVNTEMYARVSVAVLFDRLADLADGLHFLETDENAQAALHCGKLFLLELLDAVVNDKDLAKELYKKYSAIHRRKVRAWQMICVLSRFASEDIIQRVTSTLHACLYRNNLPAVRQYLETFAIQIYLKYPSLVGEQLIPIFRDYNMRPQALASYVFIAANVILHTAEAAIQSKHLKELLPPLVPFLTSHHHSLRGFTQVLVYQVLFKLVPILDQNDSEDATLEKKCFVDLKSYLAENPDCTRLRTSMQGFLNLFQPNTSTSPAGIFSARDEEHEFECVPSPLLEQVIIFLNDVREDLRHSMAKDVMTLHNEGITVGETKKDSALLSMADEEYSIQLPKDLSLDFQKKITLYKHERQVGDTSSMVDDKSHEALLGQLLMDDHPTLFWTPCAAHCIDLMLHDICKLPIITTTVKRAIALNGYIYNHPYVLNMMRTFTEQKELIRPGVTRFATVFLTLQSIYNQKNKLRRMFTSEEWSTSRYHRDTKGKDAYETVMSVGFWNNILYYLRATGPLVRVLRLVDSEKKPAMGYIYEAMDRAKEAISKSFNYNEAKYYEIWEIIDKRWNDQLHRPLHAAGYYLNPEYFYSTPRIESNEELNEGFLKSMARLVPDEAIQHLVETELSLYRYVRGVMGSPNAIRNRALWSPGMEKDDLLLSSVILSRSTAMGKVRESREPFILMASLLERVPNLAGLARTCEVFKAAGLAIADASIVHDKQFQLISVTAEKWVPIIEVPVPSIKKYLEKKKREGFSILGLEQTANSTPLDKYSFPKKTVLVLGREKEGIPVDIIHILDACVEIPQLGVVRSLNVHVSGAIALWEYTRQQRSSKQ